MTAALAASGLGKQYGRRWALSDCTLHIPQGQVAGLVGPNGAGKTTLLHLAVGLLRPTAGTIEVLGRPPSDDAGQLGRVGFVAQDTPVYSALSVADHLRLGAWLNPRWDGEMAQRRISQVDLDPGQRAGLSGGQRAQLALTLAVAKRPELLILDEPVASLDPLARREFLQLLMATVAEGRFSIVLSSHLVADLERVCDFLVVLASSRVQVAGEVDKLLATHRRLIGPRRDPKALAADLQVIEERHTDVQSTLIVRCDGPVHDPAWTVEELSLEDVVLAYMGRARQQAGATHRRLGVRRHPSSAGSAAMIQLAWTQSIPRKRWLAVKLGLIGLSSVAVAGLLGLMVTWWSSPIDRVNADPFTVFDQRGIVPFGYAVFAFALGVTAGMLLRRTLPAMAATVVVFAGARLAVTNWVRPYLMAPLRIVSAVQAPAGNGPSNPAGAVPNPADWILSDQTVNAAGHVIGQDGAISFGGGRFGILFGLAGDGRTTLQGVGVCPNRFPARTGAAPGGGPSAAFDRAAQECITRLQVRQVLTYQPTSRYWPLQWYELAIFAGLALILAGFCFWWVRRRFA